MNLMIVSGHELINGSRELFLEEQVELTKGGIYLFLTYWLSASLFSELIDNHSLNRLRNPILQQIEFP